MVSGRFRSTLLPSRAKVGCLQLRPPSLSRPSLFPPTNSLLPSTTQWTNSTCFLSSEPDCPTKIGKTSPSPGSILHPLPRSPTKHMRSAKIHSLLRIPPSHTRIFQAFSRRYAVEISPAAIICLLSCSFAFMICANFTSMAPKTPTEHVRSAIGLFYILWLRRYLHILHRALEHVATSMTLEVYSASNGCFLASTICTKQYFEVLRNPFSILQVAIFAAMLSPNIRYIFFYLHPWHYMLPYTHPYHVCEVITAQFVWTSVLLLSFTHLPREYFKHEPASHFFIAQLIHSHSLYDFGTQTASCASFTGILHFTISSEHRLL